jgi:hypothetical protein
MPYIPEEERKVLNPRIQSLLDALYAINGNGDPRDNDGRLNYIITELLMRALELDGNPKYTRLNTLEGVLGLVKKEIYRRCGGDYENDAIGRNGDIGSFARFRQWVFHRRNMPR